MCVSKINTECGPATNIWRGGADLVTQSDFETAPVCTHISVLNNFKNKCQHTVMNHKRKGLLSKVYLKTNKT